MLQFKRGLRRRVQDVAELHQYWCAQQFDYEDPELAEP
jgi:hypothetical protein